MLNQARLIRALGNVHGDGQPFLSRERRGPFEQGVAHGIRRVRRHTRAHERGRLPAERVHLPAKAGQRVGALRRVRAEHFLVRDPAHSHLEHRAERGARVVRVGVRRNPGQQPFGDTEACGVDERFRRERLTARAREAEDPRAEVEVLQKPAHHGELEMRVRVDEPGHERDVAEVDVGAVGRTAPFADVRDAPVVLDHRTVRDRRTGDRQHPPCVVPDHVGHASRAYGSNRSSSRAPQWRASASGNVRSPT